MIFNLKTVMWMSVTSLLFVGTSFADQFVVEYRTSSWVTKHFDESQVAQKHYDTVRQLRCEAVMEEHGNHLDVRYRCPDWKALTTKTDAGAHNWQHWLKAAGFETKHEH